VITFVIIKSDERRLAGRTSVLGRVSPLGGPKITNDFTNLNSLGAGVKIHDGESLALYAIHADTRLRQEGRNNKMWGGGIRPYQVGLAACLSFSAASFFASSWSDTDLCFIESAGVQQRTSLAFAHHSHRRRLALRRLLCW
jgi:hypothetical protein